MDEDINEMLLEAAGRTGENARYRHSPPLSRRQPEDSSSDDGSDSGDDDSGDNHGYDSRKLSGSQVPLKKRLDPTSRDDERRDEVSDEHGSDHDKGDSEDDSVGSDLYKGEEDRQRLANMSELEREMILAERATKKNDKDLKDSIKKKKEKTMFRKDSSPPTVSRGLRYSARSADRSAAKDGALNELRERRQRQLDPDHNWKLRDSPVKKKNLTGAHLSTSDQSDNGLRSEDEESTGDGGMMIDSDDEIIPSSVLTFEDVKEITIRRSKLAKWSMEPFFEELIVGCFVRVGIGKTRSVPIYRLCIVRNVDAANPDRQYVLENRMTHKYLNVVWGNESSAARWQMAMVSDSPPEKEEYDQLVKEMERSGGRMPSKQEVLEKKLAIENTHSFVYSAETVKQMLQEKNSTKRRPLNVALEKDRLRREMEVAEMKNDEAEVERIKTRLQELETSRQVLEKDSKAVRLAEMNRKNRAENFKNASELKPKNTGLRAGEAGYDPFSRRWTRSRNYYVGKEEGIGEEGGEEKKNSVLVGTSGGGVGSEAGMVATAAALEAAADAGKLVDTNAPVDRGTESNLLHNFELPLSLSALQKFSGPLGVQAGFMARKQRIEATIGLKVPENDGKRHALTLSVSDYKRRRGLL